MIVLFILRDLTKTGQWSWSGSVAENKFSFVCGASDDFISRDNSLVSADLDLALSMKIFLFW